MSEREDRLLEFLAGVPLTSGPATPIRDLSTGKRIRPNHDRLTDRARYPDSMRLANLMCNRKGRRIFAVVLRGGIVATTDGQAEMLGVDWVAECGCGWDHAPNGAALRAEVEAVLRAEVEGTGAQAHGRKVPNIDLASVERRQAP